MNSARFIRRRSVLALWVITPLTVITGIVFISRSFLDREKIELMQDRTLAKLIPAMKEELSEFDRFASDYRLDAKTKLSMENQHIILFNTAAENTSFTITAIRLEQDSPNTAPPGTVRISLFVKGSGSTRGITAFLNNVKARDKLLYEKRIQIMPERSKADTVLLEAEFGKVYFDEENGNENSIQN